MNKTQKFLLATVALGIGLAIASLVYASTAANVFVGQSSNVTNNQTVLQTNIFAGSSSNIAGVATMYIATNIVIQTNSTQLLPANDKYVFIRVVNNGAFAETVSPINPVIASNGFVIAAGGSLTFPTTAGGAIPSVLYAAPTNAATQSLSNYAEGWQSPTGN